MWHVMGVLKRVRVYELYTDRAMKFAEILSTFAIWVKYNEPTTTKYELIRETPNKSGVQNLIMMER